MQRHPVDAILIQCNYRLEEKHRIRSDVIANTTKIPTLIPRVVSVLEQNQPTKVCALEGTIPINYKGNAYNILIKCILPLFYPHTAPVIFVVPLENMIIKPGDNVEPDGRVKNWLLSS